MRYKDGKAAELKEKFWAELADRPYIFLQLDGVPTSAVPMAPQLDKDADSAIWFFTHTKSDFVRLGPVTATFQGKDMLFARFHGSLVKEDSQERFDHFWNNFVKAWYDAGKEDPNIAFLRMDLGDAEIWDGDMNMLEVAKMALGMNVHDDAEEDHVKQTQF